MAAKTKKRISKNRQINSNILKLLDIQEYYYDLPHKVKELIIESSWPKISIDINDCQGFPGINGLLEEIKEKFYSSNIVVNQKEIGLIDSANILAIDSIIVSLQNLPKRNQLTKKEKDVALLKSVEKFCKKASGLTYTAAKEVWLQSANLMADITWKSLSKYYRFDKKGLYFSFIKPNSRLKHNHCISIKTFDSEKRSFKVDGKPRESYLCCLFNKNGMNDLLVKEGVFGNIKPTKIYVQEHAVNRLMERLKLNSYGDMFLSLSNSLDSPVVSKKHSDCYFVDFYYGNYKLGYLLISLEEDAALIRTFKFITMFGTPEYFKLKKYLGGVREDFEYLGMDNLDFINSDAFTDPKLREIFKKCDLGHLFDLKKCAVFDSPQNFIAEDIKKYFRIEVKNED